MQRTPCFRVCWKSLVLERHEFLVQNFDKQRPLIGIALVQWNRVEYTVDLLNALALDDRSIVRIAICDNGSEQHCWEQLKNVAGKLFPVSSTYPQTSNWRIALFRNCNNSGFAAGINVGVQALLSTEVKWIWLLNNDVILKPGTLKRLKETLEHSEPGVYGTRIMNPNSSLCSGLNRFNKWTSRFQSISTDQADKALLSQDRSVFDSIGLLSERTFLYFEELDFARRLANSPFKQRTIKEVSIKHIGAGSSDRNDFRSTRMYHETWSTLDFYKTYHRWLYLVVLMLRTPLRIFMLCLRGRFSEVSSVLRASWDYMQGVNRDKRAVDIIEKKYFK